MQKTECGADNIDLAGAAAMVTEVWKWEEQWQ